MAKTTHRLLIGLGVVGLLGIITVVLASVTFSILNKRSKNLDQTPTVTSKNLDQTPTVTSKNLDQTPTVTSKNLDQTPTVTSTSSRPGALESTLASAIRIDDLMAHLNRFETIARKNGNTRAIGTIGFAQTVDYIQDYLQNQSYNQFLVVRESFPIQNFSIKGTPILRWTVNGTTTNFSYSTVRARTDFTYVNYTAARNLTTYSLTLVENNGCADGDYHNVAGRAVLIQLGGICRSAEKSELAAKKNASAVLFYIHDWSTADFGPATFRLGQANHLPALSLSFQAGHVLFEALNSGSSVTIDLEIQRQDHGTFSVQNICADTLHGNQTQIILIGSHSDSVSVGPGINDNGSGSAANLVLANTLARLYASTDFTKFPYRIRFCWWGAEEIGLAGAIHHVQQAQNVSTSALYKLSNYLINLNYDMLGSPNYMFGIYNESPPKPGTPASALPGSVRISEAFRDWFTAQNLPWDYTDLSGRSDHEPFLAAGIVAGGLFSGAEKVKSIQQREWYEEKLGAGRGGLADEPFDLCYHRACDNVKNIDQFGFLKMAQAAAYMLEFLGRKNDLESWLYPNNDHFREN